MMRIFWIELCNDSSIHGLRYFTAKCLHWSERLDYFFFLLILKFDLILHTKKKLQFERLFWAISVCVSLCLCGLLVKDIWIKWQENPVTMSFTEKPLHFSSIPFPTITICPEMKTVKKKFDISNTLNHLANLSEIE